MPRVLQCAYDPRPGASHWPTAGRSGRTKWTTTTSCRASHWSRDRLRFRLHNATGRTCTLYTCQGHVMRGGRDTCQGGVLGSRITAHVALCLSTSAICDDKRNAHRTNLKCLQKNRKGRRLTVSKYINTISHKARARPKAHAALSGAAAGRGATHCHSLLPAWRVLTHDSAARARARGPTRGCPAVETPGAWEPGRHSSRRRCPESRVPIERLQIPIPVRSAFERFGPRRTPPATPRPTRGSGFCFAHDFSYLDSSAPRSSGARVAVRSATRPHAMPGPCDHGST